MLALLLEPNSTNEKHLDNKLLKDANVYILCDSALVLR